MRVPLDARLLTDCELPPGRALPKDGPLTFAALENYLVAVESTLEACRGKLSELRKVEGLRPLPPTDPR